MEIMTHLFLRFENENLTVDNTFYIVSRLHMFNDLFVFMHFYMKCLNVSNTILVFTI